LSEPFLATLWKGFGGCWFNPVAVVNAATLASAGVFAFTGMGEMSAEGEGIRADTRLA
jgi:hypothetical protein